MSPVSPASVDASVRARGLTLTDLRASMPKDLFQPRAARSWLELLRVLALAAVCLFLISRVLAEPSEPSPARWAALGLLWCVYGLVLVGLFVIGHDCGHLSFSKSRWVNAWVGYLVMSPLINGFHTWRVTHNHHHAYTQLRGQEVDWAAHLRTRSELDALSWRDAPLVRLGYALPFGVFLWIGWNTLRRGAMVRQLIGDEQFERERRPLLVGNLVMGLCLFALCGGLVATVGWWGFFAYHGIPAWIAGTFGAFIIAVGHARHDGLVFEEGEWDPVRGQLSSTYNVRFPRLVEWIICDINIHIPHHVSVRIPWYNLRAAGEALRAAHPDVYQEHPFRLADLTWCVRAPVLERDEANGFLRLAPFSTATPRTTP